ncbi:E3 ubiquitin/ISG15 ligase TRIM25-like [Discoglossus pictus]
MSSADPRGELSSSSFQSCDHYFCRDCVGSLSDTEEESIVLTCPGCQAEFQGATTEETNMKLGSIVESFYSTPPEQEHTLIFCNYCVDSPVPASKTCLHCDASICDAHLKNHNTEHELIEPATSLEDRKCSIHKEFLKYYCLEDSVLICLSCFLIGDHKTHRVEVLTDRMAKKRGKMRQNLNKLCSRREEIEVTLQTLQQHNKKLQEKANGASEQATALFTDIRGQLETIEQHVQREIGKQKQQISSQIYDEIEQLEEKKEELSRKMFHTEKLCAITDPLLSLYTHEPVYSEFFDTNDAEEIKTNKISSVGDLHEFMITKALQRLFDNIMTDLKSKQTFNIQEHPDLLLDINTAACNLAVSNDLKEASCIMDYNLVKFTPERFGFCQVFSTQAFCSGQHYWEVETSKVGYWKVGMAYQNLGRIGSQYHIGKNKQSWCLHMSDTKYSVMHCSKQSKIYPEGSFERFGIYLNYEDGQLSFYQLCDPIRHLHTFTATFTEPLHAAFFVGTNGWVRIVTQEHQI